MAAARPQVLALVVCDAVHRDPSTGKHTLLGCFSALTSRMFPAVHPTVAVYAAITEGYGQALMEMRLVRPDGVQVLQRLSAEVRFDDPRTVVELAFTLTNVTFPVPEETRVQLLADGELLLERRLRVVGVRSDAKDA